MSETTGEVRALKQGMKTMGDQHCEESRRLSEQIADLTKTLPGQQRSPAFESEDEPADELAFSRDLAEETA